MSGLLSSDDYLKSAMKTMLCRLAGILIGLAIISLLSSYVYAGFQPYRGPTKIYFFGFLIAGALSLRIGIFSFIVILPLLPNLHSQLELIINPAVKYFVAFPAVDAMIGLCLGGWIGRSIKAKRLTLPLTLPPWPLALMLVVISISCSIAVARNLWLTASPFLFNDLFLSLLNFKFLARESDYFPMGDWITFSTLILLVIVLSDYLRGRACTLEIIFKPLIVGLGLSAFWGIFQSLTGFGLGGHVLRATFISFGAVGFQPDIHAFGGLMALGAIGLLGFISQPISRAWRYCTVIVMLLCWVALLQSQSRASIAITVMLIPVLLLLLPTPKKYIRQFLGGSLFPVSSVAMFCLLTFAVLYMYHLSRSGPLLTHDELNLMSSWRLDLFLGTLRMWWQFPLMGVGQGNFLRLSSEYDFSGSALMAMLGGENAHNYFLQMLAELGLVGCVCAAGIFIWPAVQRMAIGIKSSIWIAIVSLFVGNIYSHSFVIRENLFILAALLAGLYGSLAGLGSVTTDTALKMPVVRDNVRRGSVAAIICLIVGLAVLEVINADKKIPFRYASQCYLQTKSEEWKRGKLFIEVPPKVSSVKVSLRVAPEASVTVSSRIDAKLFDRNSTHIHREQPIVSKEDVDKFTIEFLLPRGEVIGSNGGVMAIAITSCLNSTDLNSIATRRKPDLQVSIAEFGSSFK